ncbi:MAG: YifB family Mg chelatase-like AAA ATPase [Deltaproteobacteria bacterium]|nr:YifB family Mg chelatase-like AAA ATPase [Candidatus Anaeroferrophillus wilburensis]MBN2889444.1 YifB family Mg chelatase-like AAA ATPase [Deltaproteobacteria bacterium]
MHTAVMSASLQGIQAVNIEVEIDVSPGLPGMAIVGLADHAIKESRDRIRAAVKNAGFAFPNRRITINLAPAHLKKEGTILDLPMAIGILAADGDHPEYASWLQHYLVVGELSLDGSVKPIRGCLSIALMARKQGYRGLILPPDNAPEAAIIEGLEVIGVNTIGDVMGLLAGDITIAATPHRPASGHRQMTAGIDFADVRGQHHAKRALEIAAGGGHNLLFIGPPGAGKSMLAKRLRTILPPLTFEEAIETTIIHSVAGTLANTDGLLLERPFRHPHHTISDAALAGGGNPPHPGEISLAHHGVLFLDELPEFRKNVLELLRQPLEDQQVTIARAKATSSFPATFILIGAMNPCPCGHYGDSQHPCTCTMHQIHKYRGKLSGPLLDRIDLHVEVPAVPAAELLNPTSTEEHSAVIRQRVVAARQVQEDRFAGRKIFYNGAMGEKDIKTFCRLEESSKTLMQQAMTKLGLSARAYSRILKVARTIADLGESRKITTSHLAEAIQYRSLDRRMML